MTERLPPLHNIKIVHKGWGCERIFASNSAYAGKILEFTRGGASMSMHHHVVKREHWYCLSGEFSIYWIDPATAEKQHQPFRPDDVWENAPGEDHQIVCLTPGLILEVSTADDPDDNYRVQPGDSQAKGKSREIPAFGSDENVELPESGTRRMVPRSEHPGAETYMPPAEEAHPLEEIMPTREDDMLGIPRFLQRRSENPLYRLTCTNCANQWIAKEPMSGYQSIRCPNCAIPIKTADWESKRRLPFRPTA